MSRSCTRRITFHMRFSEKHLQCADIGSFIHAGRGFASDAGYRLSLLVSVTPFVNRLVQGTETLARSERQADGAETCGFYHRRVIPVPVIGPGPARILP